jgi:iron complex outermembrane receptor protein
MKNYLLACFMVLLSSAMLFAQDRTVSGRVTDADTGEGIPGVNIMIQGTTSGTVSDIDGNYTVSVPADATLMFSYVGYKTQLITVGSQSTINVSLESDVTALSEIVVTGYGTQEKKEITSAVASVKSEDFNQGNVNNPAQLIQGKVAGLSISKAGGDPNGGYDIRLRGLSTVSENTSPLIVIDGIVGGSLDNVDPNDIASMDVLKDGSAAAIYGTRGSAGVILVTTKSGKEGRFDVNYNGYVSFETVAKTVDMMDASEWRALSAETGQGTDLGSSTDWFDETTQTGVQQTHNLSLSGGTKSTSYRASINFRDADGVMINSGFKQLNARLNLTQKAINDKLTLTMNFAGTRKDADYGWSDAFRYATIYNPTAPVRSDDPAFDIWDGYFNQVLFDYYNPVQILEQNPNEGVDARLNLALRGRYEIIKGLGVDVFYSIQNESFNRGSYRDKNSFWVGRDRNGLARKQVDNSFNQLFETTVDWNGDLGGTANLSLLGGYSWQEFVNDGFHAEGGDFITDAFSYNNLGAGLDFPNGLGSIDSYKNSSTLIAFFGRANLNIDETYFISASVRQEGSSRFGEDNKWGTFPAISGGVELANFLGSASIDNLKLRVSYGITGNLPADPYLSLFKLGPGTNFFYQGEYVPGYGPRSNANPDLKWEKKGEFDIGFDFALFGSKIYGALDFYSRTTSDLLFQYGVPVPPNLYNTAWVNVGEIKNSGIELALSWAAVKRPTLTYTTTITPTYYIKNELVSLSGDFNGETLTYGSRELGAMGAPGQSDVPTTKAEEGGPIGQLWSQVYEGIAENGDLLLKDTNGDGTINDQDRQVVGNGLPNFEFGWANTFTFGKNWDLNIFFRGVFGHDLLNKYRAFYEVPNIVNSYNTLKASADLRSPGGTLLNNSSGVLSSLHVEDASFFALDNLSFGYNFNLADGAAFRNIRLYLAGNNLFYITGYSGPDPNVRYADGGNPLIPGVDVRNTWFRTRTVTVGVNLGF